MKNRLVLLVILLLALSFTLGPTSAQDEPPTLPVRVLTLQFSAVPTGPPTLEFTSDGEIVVFKIDPVGTVTGDLEGTFSQHVTQVEPVDALPAINLLQHIAVVFTIETEQGVIEGYYSGAFYHPEDTFPDAIVRQHGQVLSVTAAYVDLYLADVFYDGVVDFEEVDGNLVPLGDSGTLIIAPR